MISQKIIDNQGHTFYCKPGTKILHREDGPAVIYSNGDKYWYKNGLCHREDGPAVDCSNGDKAWYINGKLHREDGYAVIYPDGDNEYWLYNNEVYCSSEEEFFRIVKLKIFK